MSPCPRRCAVYTRKSSEEGLDQSFNSLDAQREACEAYIKSQAHEGWRLIATRYDDGGVSGGTMERPALKRLLADVDAGRIDVIVVYKVDRLTRALSDFARIVDRLDTKGASFVSVTQAFNTTSSMGRLTLNVLLSFAQFEREVTGERIRDKIAASKARGMWMGGVTPLGYDAKDRTLVINAAEAQTVRAIYADYLQIESVHRLRDHLYAQGVRSKAGQVMNRGALFHLLRNRVYLGQIVHKDKVHKGLHPPILDEALFTAVQEKLDCHKVRRVERRNASGDAPLTGLIVDPAGAPMSPTFSVGRGGRRYRYYVSSSVLKGLAKSGSARQGDDALVRVPALALEGFILKRLQRFDPSVQTPRDLTQRVQRVSLRPSSVRLELLFPEDRVCDRHDRDTILGRTLPGDEAQWKGHTLHITVPIRMQFRGGRALINTEHAAHSSAPAIHLDQVLISALRRAHATLAELNASPHAPPKDLVFAKAPANSYHARLYRLATLAPDIQKAILTGRQPASLMLQTLMDNPIPLSWVEQRAVFGFAEP